MGAVRIEKSTLNAQEVADRLGLSRATVIKAAKAGAIPHLRAGDRIVFPRAPVERFLETGSFDGFARQIDAGAIAAEVVRQILVVLRETADARLASLQGEPMVISRPDRSGKRAA